MHHHKGKYAIIHTYMLKEISLWLAPFKSALLQPFSIFKLLPSASAAMKETFAVSSNWRCIFSSKGFHKLSHLFHVI